MRNLTIAVLLLLLAVPAAAQVPATPSVWDKLKAKRESLGVIHQEFELTERTTTEKDSQESVRLITLDMSEGLWLEKHISGVGTVLTLYDGRDILIFEDAGAEFTRSKVDKKATPLPLPYISGVDLSKLKQTEERPCDIGAAGTVCVVLEGPFNRTSGGPVELLQGTAQFHFDAGNGLLVYYRKVRQMRSGKTSYTSEATLRLKSARVGASDGVKLFELPSPGMREVRKLTEWDTGKIKKELTGKPAPELTVKDLDRKQISLTAYRGKVVLLDFWATWCPPCRADGPALNTLQKKYGNDLAIVGISVDEGRSVVEKYLKDRPHSFPIVLTTENEMPRPYQVRFFPTYIVVGRDGVVVAVASDEQGMGKFQGMLKKAGLKTD